MKRTFIVIILLAIASSSLMACDVWAYKKFSWGWHRDVAWLDAWFPPQCLFPPLHSPHAVPCRHPGIQKQTVPCAFKTACPSKRSPCHGIAYGLNPYPLFR